MGSRDAKPPPPGPGRHHGIMARYVWPATGEEMTVGEAIPKWMRTAGMTWDEAAAAVGANRRTIDSWINQAAAVHRGLFLGRDIAGLSVVEAQLYAFIVAVNLAAAEVTARWQQILETEGQGGYPLVRTTVVERCDPDGKVLERVTTTVTETARPDVKVIQWKMAHQLKRYRDRQQLVFVNVDGDGITLPEPSDEDRTTSIAQSLRMLQQQNNPKKRRMRKVTEPIETTATEDEA